MGNTLVRVPDVTIYPGTAAIPPTPRRCVSVITGYRTIREYVTVTVNTPLDGQWVQDESLGLGNYGGYVFIPAIPDGFQGISFSGTTPERRLVTRRVPVYSTTCTPATAGVPGTPTVIERDAGPDWFSSAKSIKFVNTDGRFTFALVGNAAAGLTSTLSTDGVALGQITYGVAAVDGNIRLVRLGQILGVIAAAADYDAYDVAVYKGKGVIRGVSGTTSTVLNSSNLTVGTGVFAAGLINTETSTVDSPELVQLRSASQTVAGSMGLIASVSPANQILFKPTGRLALQAATFSSVNGVRVDTPTGALGITGAVTERVFIGLGALGLEGRLSLTGLAFSSVNGVRLATIDARMPVGHTVTAAVVRAFTATGGVSVTGGLGLQGEGSPAQASGAAVRVSPLQFYAGNRLGLYGDMAITPMLIDGGSTGGAPVAQFASADLAMAEILLGASGLTGEIGGATDATYTPMYTVGSNYAYSYGTPAIPEMILNSGGGVLGTTASVSTAYLEFLSVADYFNTLAAILVEFTSELDVSGDMSITIALNASMESALNLSDDMTLAQILEAVISDGLTLSDGQAPEAAAYKQYVYNLLSGAASRFDGFDFKGFAHFNGETYAYNTTGVHRVVNTPADPIAAMVDLGVSTFGVSSMKHVETAYIGLATDGEVFLKLVADGRDKTYRVVQRFPTMRAHTGRGVVGREWGVQLQLLDATTADLDDIEFVLATSGRRWTR